MKDNAKWLVVCRFFQSLLQMAAGMLVARYLGPGKYGLLGYAASVTAFAIPLAQLGLHAILVQELGQRREESGTILGTAMGMQLLSGLACLPGTLAFSLTARPGDWESGTVCLIQGCALVFQAGETLQYWFHVRGKMKTVAIAGLGATGAVCAGKLLLMAAERNVRWFAFGNCLQYLILGLRLRIAYRGGRLRFSRKTAGRLLHKGKYYIAAGMMTVVFHNTDHIMLTLLAGEAENGLYTAAMTCAGAAGFLYNSILDAARPEVLASCAVSREAGQRKLVALYRLILGLALGEGLAVTLAAKPMVAVLYGNDYLGAAGVLRLLIWYLGFSYMGSIRNLWILAEEKHSCLWIINLGMAVGNGLLNAWLIPPWGALGAAGATVLTQLGGNFLLGFFWKPLKENQRLLLKAMGKECEWYRSK